MHIAKKSQTESAMCHTGSGKAIIRSFATTTINDYSLDNTNCLDSRINNDIEKEYEKGLVLYSINFIPLNIVGQHYFVVMVFRESAPKKCD